MIKNILILLLIFISIKSVGQNVYQKELSNFLKDIFSDTYKYTYDDFLRDSLEAKKNDAFSFEYPSLKDQIDTTYSKYMLRTDYGKMHFDTLFIVSNPVPFYYDDETNNLTKFLTCDTIFEMLNPFKKESVNECIRAYKLHKNKIKFQDYFNADFIKWKDLNKMFNKADAWENFHKLYGDGYVMMTLPIFSVDNEYAYFEWSYDCGGLCGYGYAGLYKKQNGKWTAIKVIMSWIS